MGMCFLERSRKGQGKMPFPPNSDMDITREILAEALANWSETVPKWQKPPKMGGFRLFSGEDVEKGEYD
jgi:hypothetical protein